MEFEYSFSLTRQKIISESLYFYRKGRIKEIFTHDERLGKTKKEKYYKQIMPYNISLTKVG